MGCQQPEVFCIGRGEWILKLVARNACRRRLQRQPSLLIITNAHPHRDPLLGARQIALA